MEITISHLKRCDVLAPIGRLDSAAAPELEQAFRQALDNGVYRIVLDMAGVTFLGSAAIRTLIVAYKECRRWNRGDVVLASVPERVGRVLDLAGIMPLITTYPTAVEAVGNF